MKQTHFHFLEEYYMLRKHCLDCQHDFCEKCPITELVRLWKEAYLTELRKYQITFLRLWRDNNRGTTKIQLGGQRPPTFYRGSDGTIYSPCSLCTRPTPMTNLVTGICPACLRSHQPEPHATYVDLTN